IIPDHAPVQPDSYLSDDEIDDEEEDLQKDPEEDPEETPVQQFKPELEPNHMNGFALHPLPQQENNMNGWLIEDNYEEEEVEEMDDDEMEVDDNDEDDAKVHHGPSVESAPMPRLSGPYFIVRDAATSAARDDCDDAAAPGDPNHHCHVDPHVTLSSLGSL
nr:hypothetical protein [Tanacetum cinerariifolium]